MNTRILFLTLLLTSAAHAQTVPLPNSSKAPEPAPFFSDVPRDHWAFAAVQRLAAAGILEGVGVAPPKAITVVAPKQVRFTDVTPRTKMALGSSVGLKGSLINIDFLEQKKLLVLQGTAKDEAQKQLATSIARKNAPGWVIVNRLSVAR